MSKSGDGASKKVNVEIAPGNQQRLDKLIERHNSDPERARPVLRYTDVINEALDLFFRTNQRGEQ